MTLLGIGVILITGLVAYFGLLKTDEAPLPLPVEIAPGAAGRPASSRSSLDILESLWAMPAFKKLKLFGRWPLPVEPVGNPEPFKSPAREFSGQGDNTETP